MLAKREGRNSTLLTSACVVTTSGLHFARVLRRLQGWAMSRKATSVAFMCAAGVSVNGLSRQAGQAPVQGRAG